MRSKFGIVPVYAVGLYANPGFELEAGGDPLSALKSAITAHGYTTEIRITLVRDVARGTFVKALEEQILPRSSKCQCAAFAAAFTAGLGETLPNKFTLVMRLFPEGTIDIVVDATVVSSVSAPEVADALLEVYLGANAVSTPARDAIHAGLRAF